MLTLAKVHQALTAAAGNMKVAAEELGVRPIDLKLFVARSPDLALLWAKPGSVEAPTVSEAYDRDPPEQPRKDALAEAFGSQEQKLQKYDWKGLGVDDPKTLGILAKFEQGVGKGVLRMMDAMQGGMAFCFAKVTRQFYDVAAELEDERGKPTDTMNPLEKRDEAKVMLLHQQFMELAREMQKFNKEAVAAANLRLQLQDKAKKMQEAGRRMKQAGWGGSDKKTIDIKAEEK